MSINRNSFIEAFAPSTPGLNLIFLNHLGAPTKLLTDVPTIEMLSDKHAKIAFIEYCKSHPLVKDLVLSPQYRKTNILVQFLDGSEMNFSLITKMVRKTMLCLNIPAIRKSAFINEFGMLVPKKEYHFEYMVLKCQFSKDPLSDRYKNYFAGFEFNERAEIFKYMQTRFNLIFNTLEDLYKPKANMLLAIMIGLRGEKKNSLFQMFLRSFEVAYFRLFGSLIKREVYIKVTPKYNPELNSAENKRSAGHAM